MVYFRHYLYVAMKIDHLDNEIYLIFLWNLLWKSVWKCNIYKFVNKLCTPKKYKTEDLGWGFEIGDFNFEKFKSLGKFFFSSYGGGGRGRGVGSPYGETVIMVT